MLRYLRQAGLTLPELMIASGITAFSMAWAAPSLLVSLQNADNRAAAESVVSGLQVARMEAIKRNAEIRFTLNDTSGRVAWSVGCATPAQDCPAVIHTRLSNEGGANARIGVSREPIPAKPGTTSFLMPLPAGAGLSSQTGVTFDGLGRTASSGIGVDVTRVDVTNPKASKSRRLVIVIHPGGKVRMCDPAVGVNNPQSCA